MSVMTPKVRKAQSGDLDVYTGLLLAAFLVLLAGVSGLYVANSRQVEDLRSMTSENALFGVPGFDLVK